VKPGAHLWARLATWQAHGWTPAIVLSGCGVTQRSFSTLCKSTILRAPSLLGGHHFQQMTVEFPEIEGPAATAVCDLAVRLRGRPAAVGHALRLHPPKDAIELLLRDVKRVMVALQLVRHKMEDASGVCVVGKVDGEVLVGRHLGEAPFRGLHREAKDLGEELGRGAFVLRWNDQVVSCDCHVVSPSTGLVVTDNGLSEFLPEACLL
jgi:hypothetical protein